MGSDLGAGGRKPGTTAREIEMRKAAVPPGTAASCHRMLFLAVADAVDRAGPVVGNEDRAVLGEDDVVGTAEIALVALEPAGGEPLLLGVLAVGTDDHPHDACALILVTIPRAVL